MQYLVYHNTLGMQLYKLAVSTRTLLRLVQSLHSKFVVVFFMDMQNNLYSYIIMALHRSSFLSAN